MSKRFSNVSLLYHSHAIAFILVAESLQSDVRSLESEPSAGDKHKRLANDLFASVKRRAEIVEKYEVRTDSWTIGRMQALKRANYCSNLSSTRGTWSPIPLRFR